MTHSLISWFNEEGGNASLVSLVRLAHPAARMDRAVAVVRSKGNERDAVEGVARLNMAILGELLVGDAAGSGSFSGAFAIVQAS